MGSQQTRELAHDDLLNLAGSPNNKFANDICLLIFSFINSEDEFYNFIKNYSKVSRQWRILILQYCGLQARIGYCSPKELKSKISNGILKYCYLRSLTVNNSQMKGSDINGICNGLYAQKLKELNVNYNQLDDKSASIIATMLPSLEVLRARSCSFTDKAIITIAQSEKLNQLKVLDLNANSFTQEGILAICSSPHMKNLTEINTGYCDIGSKVAIAMVNAFKLKKLEVFSGRIGDEGMVAIANSPNMVDLQYLNVQSNNIGEIGTRALIKSEHVKNLTKLDISSNNIGAIAGRELLESDILKNIKSLKIGSCGIDVEGAQALANNPAMQNLTSLSLRNNAIGPEGACALGNSFYLGKLRRLNLHANQPTIGDKGMLGLAASNHEPIANMGLHLEVLEIGLNNIGDVGLKAFANMAFPVLKELDLSYNTFTDSGDTLLTSSIYLKSTNVKKFDCPNLSSYRPRVCH